MDRLDPTNVGSRTTKAYIRQHADCVERGFMEIVTRRMWAQERAYYGYLSMYIYGRKVSQRVAVKRPDT